jgi:hypothetical protein
LSNVMDKTGDNHEKTVIRIPETARDGR